MKCGAYVIALVIFCLILFPVFVSVSADELTLIDIHIIGENEQKRYGLSKIVAGIWHQLNMSLEEDDVSSISIKFYKGEIMPIGERNATNYYEWGYNENSENIWDDLLKYGGRTYIDSDNCLKNGNKFSFIIGIKDIFPNTPLFYHENWTLDIIHQEKNIYSERIVVEKPTLAFAKSHGDILNFYIEPFTEMINQSDDYITIINSGNLPLDVSLDYLEYNDFIEIIENDIRVSPYEGKNFNLNLISEVWKPGIAKSTSSSILQGKISSTFIIPTSELSFQSAYQVTAPLLKIYVGHNNYEIIEIENSNIVFQHEKNLEMYEGEIEDIHVYISGEGTVSLDIWSDEKNITILNIKSENVDKSTPLKIFSTEDDEYEVILTVEALRENKIGNLYFELTTENTTKTFITQISILPPLNTQSDLTISPFTTIIVIICLLAVIGYIVITHLKHRRKK